MPRLELFYPVKPFHVNQKFGENPQIYRQFNLKGHNGLDLLAVHGQPVYASHDGMAFWEVDENQGEGVVLITTDQFYYNGLPAYYKTIYWHLADYGKEPHLKSPVLDFVQKNVKKSMPVKRGDLLGFADNTGFSTGDHLHFGLKPLKSVDGGPVSPEDATDVGNYQNIEQLNGYSGAIDPTVYFNGTNANDHYDFLYDMGVALVNADVLNLQRRLGVTPATGFLGMGIYGPKTRAAVIEYQAKYKIPQTGSVGPMTRAALNRGWI